MRIVFISKKGDVLPLAQRIEAEGNSVEMYVCSDEGLVLDNHILNFSPDLIVIDSYGFGFLANRLRKREIPVLGGSPLTDHLDDDESASDKLIQMCGLPTNSSGTTPLQIDGWFNGKDFVNIIYTLDDISFPGQRSDKLFQDCLMRLAHVLKRSEYFGPISIQAFVGKDSIHYANFRARFSASTMLLMLEGLKGRVTDALTSLARGTQRAFMFKPGWFTTIQVSINPNPLFAQSLYYTIDAPGLTDEIVKHLWLYGFTKRGKDEYIYRGKGGRLAVVSARGDTIREARRRAYRTIYNLKLPGILYLQKIGHKATPQYGSIKSWGYIS